MSRLRSFTMLKESLEQKYQSFEWFNELAGYLQYRCLTILNRFWDTFRYVDPSPDNADVFSYEYASLLRDIGSVFGSVLDTMVRNTEKTSDELSISDYRRFLNDNIENFDSVGVQFHLPFSSRYFFPFKQGRLVWWDGYNNVKHSDSLKFRDGCLSNVLYGLASLVILHNLMMHARLQRYCLVGFFGDGPEEDIYPFFMEK